MHLKMKLERLLTTDRGSSAAKTTVDVPPIAHNIIAKEIFLNLFKPFSPNLSLNLLIFVFKYSGVLIIHC